MVQNESAAEASVFTSGSKLLCLLSKKVGKILTHTLIRQSIWGSSWDNDIAFL